MTTQEALSSSALAFVCAVALFAGSRYLDGVLETAVAPTDNPAFLNIWVAGKTIVQGGAWLLTFMFWANAAGTLLLGGRMLVDEGFRNEINKEYLAEPAGRPEGAAEPTSTAEKEREEERERKKVQGGV